MEFLMEGDSPSFMHLIHNGLEDPEHPNYGNWDGRYEFYQPRTERWFSGPETRPLWTDAMDEVLTVTDQGSPALTRYIKSNCDS